MIIITILYQDSLCSVAILIDFGGDDSIEEYELMVSKKGFDQTILGQLNLPKAPASSVALSESGGGAGPFADENSEFALTPQRKNKVQKIQTKVAKTRALWPLLPF